MSLSVVALSYVYTPDTGQRTLASDSAQTMWYMSMSIV